jgi:transposase
MFVVYMATPHCSKVTKAYLDANKDTIRLEFFPIGSTEFNASEQCWRHGNKYHLLSSYYYYPTFANLKDTICSYYRTKDSIYI